MIDKADTCRNLRYIRVLKRQNLTDNVVRSTICSYTFTLILIVIFMFLNGRAFGCDVIIDFFFRVMAI